MKVLLLHSYYGQRGGEDEVFDQLVPALAKNVELMTFTASPVGSPAAEIAHVGLRTVGMQAGNTFERTLDQFKPDIVHANNLFPRLSVKHLAQAHEAGAKTVLTLHNFRYTCVNGLLLRGDRPCTDCIGASGLSGVLHRCYRGSYAASLAALALQKRQNSAVRRGAADVLVVLNEFARQLAEACYPGEAVRRIPNFVRPAPILEPAQRGQKSAVVIGRASPEKGLLQLFDAWRKVPYPLTVIGSRAEDFSRAQIPPNVAFAGQLPREQVFRELNRHAILVFPSLCFENMPMAVVEALSMGVPVVCSSHGAAAQLIAEANAGVSADIWSPSQFAAAVVSLTESEERDTLGENGRTYFETFLREDVVVNQIISLYRELTGSGSGSPH